MPLCYSSHSSEVEASRDSRESRGRKRWMDCLKDKIENKEVMTAGLEAKILEAQRLVFLVAKIWVFLVELQSLSLKILLLILYPKIVFLLVQPVRPKI